MPNIKTVKPAGDGHYTTLQAWEDFADGEANADQWAECYTGGNLGNIVVSTWVSTSDALNYPRIYVADGEGHNGDITAGAYITSGTRNEVTIHYTRFEGLRVDGDGSIAQTVTFSEADGTHIVGCFIHNGKWGIKNVAQSRTVNGLAISIMSNNIIITGGSQYGIEVGSLSAAGGITDYLVQNNTIYRGTNGRVGISAVDHGASGGANITVENNISIGSWNEVCYSVQVDAADGTIVWNNNISSDGTADDFGGTGHIVDETDTNIFTNPAENDFTLKSGSAAIGAGKDVASVTNDILGSARPAGGYDIGAYQSNKVFDDVIHYIIPSTVPTENKSDIRVGSAGVINSSEKRAGTANVGSDGLQNRMNERLDDTGYYDDNQKIRNK